MDSGQIILFQTQGGETKIEVRLSNETVWLTADQMAELFQRNKSTISRHIKNIIESGELQRNSVVAENATTAADGKTYTVSYYNLDMIISVGYRVNSHRGVQFRQWATQVLKEYMIKGFALNDDLLKNAGQGNYFDELLTRIRDIRSSEKVFYRKVLEIYALSIDYDPRTSITQQFFNSASAPNINYPLSKSISSKRSKPNKSDSTPRNKTHENIWQRCARASSIPLTSKPC